MTLPAYFQKTLGDLCDVLKVPQVLTARNPEHALAVLSTLYGYRLVPSGDRMTVRNNALQETARVWGERDGFTTKVRDIVADFAADLQGFYPLPNSNRELIEEFRSIARVATVLEFVGIGSPLGGSARKGGEELIKSGSVRDGLRAAGRRFLYGAGSGVAEAAVARLGLTGPWGIAIVGAATITYFGIVRRMEQIRTELANRRAHGAATDEEVAAVQNKALIELAADALKAYWQ